MLQVTLLPWIHERWDKIDSCVLLIKFKAIEKCRTDISSAFLFLHCLCSSMSGSPVPAYQCHRNCLEKPISSYDRSSPTDLGVEKKEVVGRDPFYFQRIGRRWRPSLWSEDQWKINLPAPPYGGRERPELWRTDAWQRSAIIFWNKINPAEPGLHQIPVTSKS